MARSISALALLAVFTAGPAAGAPTSDLSVTDLSRVDVRGTAQSITMLSQEVQALSPAHRAQAAASLHTLSVNCPYTRAAMQLPFALHDVAMQIDPASLDRLVEWDWEHLQQGLRTHVALLDSLDVTLPLPAPGDALYGHERVMIDRDTLQDLDDPIRATSALIGAITPIAWQIEAPAMEVIEDHSERVEVLTGIQRPCPRGPWSILPGQPWTLGMQLGGWHDALRRIEPFVSDPEAAEQVGAMIAALDAYSEAQFESRAVHAQ